MGILDVIADLPLLAALAGILGVGLVAWGRRGPYVDAHPCCRRCRFNLRGVYPERSACPECGADLTAPRAVQTGRRQPRPLRVLTGWLLLVLAAAGVGATGWKGLAAVDWCHYKPVSALLREVCSSRATPGDNPALQELRKRLIAGRLDRVTIDRISDWALFTQIDFLGPRDDALHWLDTARRVGALDDGRWQRYVAQAMGLALHVWPQVRRGDPLVWAVAADASRCGPELRPILQVHVAGLEVDGKPVVLAGEPARAMAQRYWGDALWFTARYERTGHRPGRHELRVHLRCQVWSEPHPNEPPRASPWTGGPPVATWTTVQTGWFERIDADGTPSPWTTAPGEPVAAGQWQTLPLMVQE